MDPGGLGLSALENPWKSERVEFECSSCGATYEVSYRYANEIRRKGLPRTCNPCRIPLEVNITDVLLDWWKARYTDEEMVELSFGLYGRTYPPSTDGVMFTNLHEILSTAADS